MKKVYLAALLSLSLMTANAQEPNIPMGMFGGMQNTNVKFDEYKAAPQGFDKERAGIPRGWGRCRKVPSSGRVIHRGRHFR